MPLIRRRSIAFSLEHMAQMPTAITAHDLGATHAKRAIGVASDRSRDSVEECGPAAAGLKFVVGFVEWSVAGGAGVDAGGGVVLVVFTGVGGFGSFLTDDTELL